MNSNRHQNTPEIAKELLTFIDNSPTPFHATANLVEMFRNADFETLNETDNWNCEAGKGYVVTRNESSVIAFRLGSDIESGIRMTGAHTDSPCLKVKPKPHTQYKNYHQLGVEVYGGVLLHPWLDRDLSIAGRVSGIDKSGELFSALIDFKEPIAIIPNLAIHLDRTANKERAINAQQHLPLILSQREGFDFNQLLLEQCGSDCAQILDYELACYDTQAAQFVGLDAEFISTARLDNLLSSFVAAKALIDSDPSQTSLYISNDHEEVGSSSTSGAQGPFLRSVIDRLLNNPAQFTQTISRSSMISCDNAHGVHPNYADKHDGNHGPILNGGPVIKVNNNQRYATNSISSAKFQHLCQQVDVPVQQFVMRSDLACGSTIGPITATQLGVETLDIGAAQWAMHSIRETAGTDDIAYLHKVLVHYYNH